MKRNLLAMIVTMALISFAGFTVSAVPISQSENYQVIETELADQLDLRAEEDFIPVLIVLADPLDGQQLIAEARAIRNLAQRRQYTIDRLREQMRRKGSGLRSELQQLSTRGQARGVEELWIAQSWAAQLKPAAILQLAKHPAVGRLSWDRPLEAEQFLDEQADQTSGARMLVEDGSMSVDLIQDKLVQHGVRALWDQGYYGQGILTGVIDTGVDTDHPNLVDRIWHNPGEIAGNAIDDDNNGFIDDTTGWNFVGNNPDVEDVESHGTHSAGLVVGDGTTSYTFNNIDTTGAAPAASMIPLRIYESTSSSDSRHLAAVQYAVQMGVRILTASISYSTAVNPDYAAHRAAHDAALAAGLLKLNSTGNSESAPVPWNINCPANVPPPWLHPDQTLMGGVSSVLAVGAVQNDSSIYSYSGDGPSAWENSLYPAEYRDYPYENGQQMGLLKPDLVAFSNLTTLTWGGGFQSTYTGTSASTPLVAGLAALLLSAHPQATPAELTEAMMSSAVDLGEPGKDNAYGAGMVQIDEAHSWLESYMAYGSLELTVQDENGTPINGVTVLLDGVVERSVPASPAVLGRIRSGPNTLRVVAEGYQPYEIQGLQVLEGDTVAHTAVLSSPGSEIVVLPDLVQLELEHDASFSSDFEVISSLDSAYDVSTALEPTAGYDMLADDSLNESDPFFSTIAVRAVSYFDDKLILAGLRSGAAPMFWRFDSDGSVVDSMLQHGELGAAGAEDFAAFSDTLLAAGESAIYLLDRELGLVDSLALPGDPLLAVAYDTLQQQLYISRDEAEARVYAYSRAGAALDTLQVNSPSYGLAWDGASIFGPTLYLLNRGSAGLNQLERYDFNAEAVAGLAVLADATVDAAVGLDLVAMETSAYRRLLVGGSFSKLKMYDREVRQDAYLLAESMTLQPGTSLLPFELHAAAMVPGQSYEWQVVMQGQDGLWEKQIPVNVHVTELNSVEPEFAQLPTTTRLEALYPNPFNPTLTVRYALRESGAVRLTVYDLLGREVASLVDDVRQAGEHTVRWHGAEQASGLYVVVLEQGAERDARKALLLK